MATVKKHTRFHLGVLVLAAVGLGACGSSSSSSPTTTAPTSTTASVPGPAEVVKVCHHSAKQFGGIATILGQATASTTWTQVDQEIAALSAPLANCQAIVQSALPGLPTSVQSAANAYANSFSPLIQLVQSPPSSVAALTTWNQQFTTLGSAVAQSKAALIQADHRFAAL